MAASGLVAPADEIDVDCPAVDQLVRCAELSSNAAQTLDWALQTLRAHSVGHADQVACELLHAARARVDAQRSRVVAPRAEVHRGPPRSLAWV